MWASPLLETVFGPEPKCEWTTHEQQAGGISLWGDLELLVLVFGEVRRSYTELPVRLLCDLVLPRARGLLVPSSAGPIRVSTQQEIMISYP